MNPFRRRRRSEAEDIDGALNAYLTDASYPAETREATQILNTHRMAMSAVRSDPAATGPAAGTWNRVLRATTAAQPITEGRQEMSAAVVYRGTPYRPIADHERKPKNTERSFLSTAASLLVIATIAVGGWIASTQLQPVPEPNPRFAALGLQSENAGNGVCEVEPLTVDEAIAILNDPLGTLLPELDDPVAVGYPAELFGRRQLTVRDPYLVLTNLYYVEWMSLDMQEQQFSEAKPVVDEYLDCFLTGTTGQAWRLMDPITVQFQLATALPTLVSEDEARVLLPEILATPGEYAAARVVDMGDTPVPSMRVNPDITQTAYWAAGGFYGFDGFAISPVQVLDANGSVLTEADLRGKSLTNPDKPADFALNVVYGQSPLNLQWYVIDVIFPTNVPGWN